MSAHLLLAGGRVFTGDSVIEHGFVEIDGTRIAAVGRMADRGAAFDGKVIEVAGLIALLEAGPAAAQDASGAGRTLPAICTAGASASTGSGSSMSMGSGSAMGMSMQPGAAMQMGAAPADPAHQELMQGMAAMDANMDKAMTAKNIDVAFVCAMIPHHQGAIDMAKAELANGKDPFARQMAQNVVTAQEKEIADMLAWLAKQPQ